MKRRYSLFINHLQFILVWLNINLLILLNYPVGHSVLKQRDCGMQRIVGSVTTAQ